MTARWNSRPLGTLSGSANPSASGIYTYTPAAGIALSPQTGYFIVLTSGTTIANGAYEWVCSNRDYNPMNGWYAQLAFAAHDNYRSNDGLDWNLSPAIFQFAIDASPIPEPSALSVSVLGSGALLYARRKFRR